MHIRFGSFNNIIYMKNVITIFNLRSKSFILDSVISTTRLNYLRYAHNTKERVVYLLSLLKGGLGNTTFTGCRIAG